MKEFLRLPKQIQLGESLGFLAKLLGNSIFPFMSLYYSRFFGNFWTGILIIITQVMSFLAALYGGHMTDAWGRKKVLNAGNIGGCLGFLLVVFANSPYLSSPLLTFFGFLLVQTTFDFSGPAYDAMLIDLTTEDNRRFVYTIGYWLTNLATMLGAALSGLFFEKYFFNLAVALFLFAVFEAVIIAWKFEESKPDDMDFSHGQGVLDILKNYGQVLVDKPFILYTFGGIAASCMFVQVDTYLSVHFASDFHPINLFGVTITGPKMLSTVVFINALMVVGLMTAMGRLTKPMKLLPQFCLGNTIFGLGLLAAMVFDTFVPLVLSAIFYTLGEIIYVPASQVLRADMMNEDKLGTYSGFLSLTYPLGSILAGALVSLSSFTGAIGVQIAFALIVVLGQFCVLYAARLRGIKK